MNPSLSPDPAPFHVTEVELPPPNGVPLGASAKRYLGEARERLRRWHENGASGAEIVAGTTAVMDRLIGFLFDAAVAEYSRRNVRVHERFAVFAQGGYGRAELSPGSDIDLLCLYSWKTSPFVETVTETILYALWDAGLQVGHAVRSLAECTRLAGSDFKVKTALLDARFLTGDGGMAAEFDRVVDREILRKGAERFFKEKLRESEERHRQYGDSVYLLEPHLKEGEGGLRDLHTALWMARVKFKIRDLREIVQKGVVSERDYQSMLASRDFLWRVRNTLHFLSETHQDQLTFEYQERVAEVLGYRDRDERRAVERFMQDYYLHAANVSRTTNLVVERCVPRGKHHGRLYRRMFARAIRPGVRIVDGELVIENSASVVETPANLVNIFLDSERHDVPLSPSAAALVRDASARLATERENPEIVESFLEILRGRSRVYETLRAMFDAGVLGQILPEFGQLRCMVIRDFYHIYTVDEHTLRGVYELECLTNGVYRDIAPLLTQVMHEIERRDVLLVAMLLHDIGKGHGQGHSDRGARLAIEIARRLSFHEDDAGEIERLVRHHLLMSHFAQHRDLDDDRLIIDFAKMVGDVETLKKLYVMTFADMRAVAPKVWNNWREHLLTQLYVRTLEVFARGEFVPEDHAARLERVKERLREAVDEDFLARETLEGCFRSLPASYFFSASEETFLHHIGLVREYRRGEPLVTSALHFPSREFTEFTVVTTDRPGLFSMIAGALAAHGVNILAAQITTTSEQIALDVFRVSHDGEPDLERRDERWVSVRQTLVKVLAGESVERLVSLSKVPSVLTRRLPRIATSVSIDNSGSESASLLEVSTEDDVGVLFAITHALYRLGCAIHLARISTVLRHVYDVFYVTDRDGSKITSPWRIEEVCRSVREALEAR